MRKRSTKLGAIALALVIAMVFGMTIALAAEFEDVADGHWAKEAIEFAVERNLLPPTSETTFSPGTPTTRAEYIRALAVLVEADVEEYQTSTFDDVEDGDPFMPYIEWAVDYGVVTGKTPEIYDPDGEITREQMSAMMYRLASYLELAPPEGVSMLIGLTYEDVGDIAVYAVDAVTFCSMKGVMTGMPGSTEDTISFEPRGNTTRAMASLILQRFLENVLEEGPSEGEEPEEPGEPDEPGEPEDGQDPLELVKEIAASVAETIASSLSGEWGDKHAEMMRGGEGTEYEDYGAMQLALADLAATVFENDEVLYVYALVPAGSDAEPPYAVTVDGSGDALDYMTEFIFQSAFGAAWEGEAVASDFAWENDDGELYWTGFAPVYDSESLVVAIVAVSIPAPEAEEFPELIQPRGIIEG